VTFVNTSDEPAVGLKLGITVPGKKWTSVVQGAAVASKTFNDPVAPGASVSATFKVTSGPEAFNGDLVANASWTNQANGAKHVEMAAEKVRNVSPVKINEFRISSNSPASATDSFIELYNAGTSSVDISNWTLTEHPTQQAIFSAVKIPAGTNLAGGGFYLLGLANSGLSVPARAGDKTIYVRSIAGMKPGDTISVDNGSGAESRKVASVGTAASNHTTLWQPLPDGPVITIPAGSKNVPVTSVAGFTVGEKIALGYGATYPDVARGMEKYELATVTAIGKPGTQAYLGEDAPAGATNIKVTSLADISVGDKIRLDIDSPGHGIEFVTVTHVGTKANQTNLSAEANVGATHIRVRRTDGFAAGDKIAVGTPANREYVTVTTVSGTGQNGAGQPGAGIDITPGLSRAHRADEWVVSPGTGLDLAAPLKFNHAANMPFSDRGTGITFEPATAFAHSSNEPVQALGTGITLDSPLTHGHAINAVVRDAAVTTAGYQGNPEPNQRFGGPELTTNAVLFGRFNISVREGSMVLRDAAGLVVDSLNYGGLVDPWAAEGYQGVSGPEQSGCRVTAPGPAGGFGPAAAVAINTSAGRFPDGFDTDSNCTDFLTQAATSLPVTSAAGPTNIKVASVAGFSAGESILIDTGANQEKAVIAEVGTAGASTLSAATAGGVTVLPVGSGAGFSEGQTITIGNGADAETAVIASVRRFPVAAITVTAPLTREHAAGAPVAGSGITLTAALSRDHAAGAQVSDNAPTPGGPNKYSRRRP
jgi:hypothetical protein